MQKELDGTRYLVFTAVCLVFIGFTGFYWVSLGFIGFHWVLLGFIGFYWVIWMFTGQSWRGRRRPRRRRHLDAYGAAKVDLEPFHSVRGRRRPEMNECDNRSDGQRQQRSKKKKHSHTRPIATFEIGFCKKKNPQSIVVYLSCT